MTWRLVGTTLWKFRGAGLAPFLPWQRTRVTHLLYRVVGQIRLCGVIDFFGCGVHVISPESFIDHVPLPFSYDFRIPGAIETLNLGNDRNCGCRLRAHWHVDFVQPSHKPHLARL